MVDLRCDYERNSERKMKSYHTFLIVVVGRRVERQVGQTLSPKGTCVYLSVSPQGRDPLSTLTLH